MKKTKEERLWNPEGRRALAYLISVFCFLAVRNFVLIPQHVSPDFAVAEVDALYDVVTDVQTRWKTNVNKRFQVYRPTNKTIM